MAGNEKQIGGSHFRTLPRPEVGRNKKNAAKRQAIYLPSTQNPKPEVDTTLFPPTVTSSKWPKKTKITTSHMNNWVSFDQKWFKFRG